MCRLLKGSNKIVGINVGHYKEKDYYGHRCRPLQGKKMLWVLPSDLKENKNPKSRIKWGSSLV